MIESSSALSPTWILSHAHARQVLADASRGQRMPPLAESAARTYLRWLHTRVPVPASERPAPPPANHARLFSTAMRRAGSLRAHAQAPYSNFPVGAALVCADGTVAEGVNVESSSYGGTICAERSALVSALSGRHDRFVLLAVRATTVEPISPCGACRQLLFDYAPDLLVVMLADDGRKTMAYMRELLPLAFGRTDLAGAVSRQAPGSS
ncbi:MAG: cytidine deaminase [Candidatus Kapaibacterium sp.]